MFSSTSLFLKTINNLTRYLSYCSDDFKYNTSLDQSECLKSNIIIVINTLSTRLALNIKYINIRSI